MSFRISLPPYTKCLKLGTLFQMTYKTMVYCTSESPFVYSPCHHLEIESSILFYFGLYFRRVCGHHGKKEHWTMWWELWIVSPRRVYFVPFQVTPRLQLYWPYLECKKLGSRDHVLFMLLPVPRTVLASRYLDKLKYPSYYRCIHFRQKNKKVTILRSL